MLRGGRQQTLARGPPGGVGQRTLPPVCRRAPLLLARRHGVAAARAAQPRRGGLLSRPPGRRRLQCGAGASDKRHPRLQRLRADVDARRLQLRGRRPSRGVQLLGPSRLYRGPGRPPRHLRGHGLYMGRHGESRADGRRRGPRLRPFPGLALQGQAKHSVDNGRRHTGRHTHGGVGRAGHHHKVGRQQPPDDLPPARPLHLGPVVQRPPVARLQHVPERTPALRAAHGKQGLPHSRRHGGRQLDVRRLDMEAQAAQACARRRAVLRRHTAGIARRPGAPLAGFRREALCLLVGVCRLVRPHLRPQRHHAVCQARRGRGLLCRRSGQAVVQGARRPGLQPDEIP